MQPTFIPPVANRTRSRRPSGLVIGIIVGVIVALIIGIGMVIISASNDPTSSMDRLNARMNSLAAYIGEGRKSARAADLVKLNSDAGILISGDSTSIKTATTEAGAKGRTKDVIAEEKALQATTLDTLKKASIDGRFDHEYIKVMRLQLEDTQALLRDVNDKSSRASVKSATKTAFDHIATILESLQRVQL